MTPVAELMQCMAVSHAASDLPLVSFHASCIMHPEEEKGTWRRAQTGRRVGDADERSGKQRFQTGICRHLFFLATKEIEIRDVKGKRDTQRKGCYPHAPDPIIEPVNATISFHDANGRMEGI